MFDDGGTFLARFRERHVMDRPDDPHRIEVAWQPVEGADAVDRQGLDVETACPSRAPHDLEIGRRDVAAGHRRTLRRQVHGVEAHAGADFQDSFAAQHFAVELPVPAAQACSLLVLARPRGRQVGLGPLQELIGELARMVVAAAWYLPPFLGHPGKQ